MSVFLKRCRVSVEKQVLVQAASRDVVLLAKPKIKSMPRRYTSAQITEVT